MNVYQEEFVSRPVKYAGAKGLPHQFVDKPKNLILRRSRRIFCFSADRCGGKTPCKRKTAYLAVFQGHWGGIGGDRVQSENL